MATDLLQGLFGPSPYEVGQARNKQALDYAVQIANMNNIQQAKMGIGQGAATLAREGAGMLGFVDPMVEEAKRREIVMAQGGDLTTSKGLKEKAAQFASAGDQQTAMKLLMLARKQEAEERKAMMDSVEMRRKEAQTERELAMAEKALMPPKPEADPTSYREWVLAGRPGTYEDFLMKGKKASGTTVTNIMPGAKELKDIPGFRKAVQDTVKPQLETIYASDKALSALDLAIKQNNPSAFQVARTQLAKAAGDSQISLREIEAAGGDPSLFGKIIDTGSVLFTGTPTIETQMNMKRTLQAIKSVAKQKGKAEIDVQRTLGREANFTEEQLGKALKFDQFADEVIGVGKEVKLKSGKTVRRVN